MSANIKSIIDIWTEFDIKKVQHELDDKVIEIAQQLESGDKSRKSLIEKTKEFRKSLNDDQRKLVGPILKQFQVEVDGSNKRSKFMEQVLLGLYKQLIDLPDPSPSLENAELKHKKAEKMTDLEIENKQLKNTLDEYHTEFAQVKNQEVTIKGLKDKIKELEINSESQITQKLREKEKELHRLFTDKEEQLQENQLDLVKRLGEAENRNFNSKLQMEKGQEELFEIKQKQDELLNAKTCEMDILLQDLDKTTERAERAERLSEQYQIQIHENTIEEMSSSRSEKLNQEHSEDMKINNMRTSSLEIELVAKEKEISQLVEDVQKLHMKSNKTKEFYENQENKLDEKLTSRDRLIENLEAELGLKKDYEEVKRELNILKVIEFSQENSDSEGAQNNQPLEILLLEKNRGLQNENTGIKNKLSDLNEKFQVISEEHSGFEVTNTELKNLVVELEKDLLKVARNKGEESGNILNNFESYSGLSNSHETVVNLDNPDDTNTINLDNEEPKNNDLTNKTDFSLFNIVSNQRERFKIKCQDLEADNMGKNQQIVFITNELDQLRSDNVKLYEKIRYLQSASGGKSAKYKQSDIENDADDETVLKKYTSAYEKRLDPFSKFSYREKQRRYANLKLHDKFTLNFGRFILSNSSSRIIFCCYFLLIHFLIFINLYHTAHNVSSHRDFSIDCAHQYKNHMAQVHGNSDFHLHD